MEAALMPDIVRKVTAFIVRQGSAGRDLLLFQHPNAGIQLPAGTVELGEDLETAVLRETTEETGLTQIEIVRCLGGIDNELAPNEIVLTQPIQVRSEPHLDALPFRYRFTRGVSLTLTGRRAPGFVEIEYTETDQFPNPTEIVLYIVGWVPETAVSTHKTRTFFELACHEQTPDRWSLPSDGGRIFAPFWAPLTALPPLVPPQHRWLEAVYGELVS